MGIVKVFVSWSGGKESSLACYKAMSEGHEVVGLLTMVATTGRHSRSHRLRKEILMAQAKATGIRTCHRRASWNTYEREFDRALTSLKREGLEGGVFGDLFTDDHRKWVEGVCEKPGLTPLLPLWGRESKDILIELIALEFETVVVAVKADLMDTSWLGRRIDQAFVDEIEKVGVDVCGEKGEYHTVVVDGPFFKKRIVINNTKVVQRDGMAFLDILDFKLEVKGETGKSKASDSVASKAELSLTV
jgi:uncharacterized protein (TIGR00290 family)